MAETTRPSRARTARGAATTKATPAKAAPAAKAKETTEAPAGREVVEYTHERDTKSYAVFVPPADSNLKGSVYAPLGATGVRMALYYGDVVAE